jgi:phosphoglycerate kinase
MQEIPYTFMSANRLPKLPTLEALPPDLAGKRVLVRIDLNDGGHTPTAVQHRMLATLPTLQHLLSRGARVVLLTHRGRPQGRVVPQLSTAPLADELSKLLGQSVEFIPDCIGRIAQTAVQALVPGQVIMLENTRFHLGEQLNQAPFAAQLAELGDLLVNEAFACAHRTQASTNGLAALLPTVLGYQFVQELKWLSNWQQAPQPRALLVGGNAVLPKLELLQRSLGQTQIMLLGGVVGQTFLAAKDLHLRQSLIEFGAVEGAREFLAEAGVLGCRVHLPRDLAVANQTTPGLCAGIRAPHLLEEGEVAQDLGSTTLATWQRVLSDTPSVVWFGSLGVWQQKEFRAGTLELAKVLLAKQRRRPSTFTLLGGNGLLQALNAEGLLEPLVAAGIAVSTGGGALQQALCGHPLPGVQALAKA